jgi:hypothetical protein
VATAYWPTYIPYGLCDYPAHGTQNTLVKELHIDWGDGSSNTATSSQTTMQSVQSNRYNSMSPCTYSIPVFKLSHHYQGPPNHTITELIEAKFLVGNETHNATFNVINYWDTPTDDTRNGAVLILHNQIISILIKCLGVVIMIQIRFLVILK